MADVRRAKRGDLVKCDIRGFVFYAEIVAAPEKVGPRVFEVRARTINAGYWLRDANTSGSRPVGPPGSEIRLRGRAVKTLFRQLKS